MAKGAATIANSYKSKTYNGAAATVDSQKPRLP
jgi:hypothetical protein